MIKKYYKSILWLIVASLVIANLVVWDGRLLKKKNLKNESMQRPSSDASFVKTLKLPHFYLENDNGAVIDSDGLNARLNVLIFFTLEDCPACLYEAEFWGEAAQVFDRSDVGLWGITTEKDRNRIQEFISEYQLSFPIFLDKGGKLKEKILSIAADLKMHMDTPYKDFTILSEEAALVKYFPNGKIKKEVYKVCTDSFAEKGGKGNIRIPFGNSLHWKV